MKEIVDQYSQEAIKKGMKNLPEEIVYLSIMEQYGRSYQDFLNTPAYLIDLIIEKNNIDFKLTKHKSNGR